MLCCVAGCWEYPLRQAVPLPILHIVVVYMTMPCNLEFVNQVNVLVIKYCGRIIRRLHLQYNLFMPAHGLTVAQRLVEWYEPLIRSIVKGAL